MNQLLTIAPCCFYPAMAGDSKRASALFDALAAAGIEGTMIGRDYILNTQDGEAGLIRPPHVPEYSRNMTGVLSLIRNGHYNEVKHCTGPFKRNMLPLLKDPKFSAVWAHFLFSVPMILPHLNGRPLIVDTHNSEWDWYDRFSDSTSNPLIKQVCRSSKRRADEMIRELPKGTIMLHVSKSDHDDYAKRRPDLEHYVILNGVDVKMRQTQPDYAAPLKKLLFFGSLAGKMSIDALNFFEAEFWPQLKDVATMTVAGSHPSESIQALCRKHGWNLKPNLTEDEVDAVYSRTHYALLPFQYGSGSKHKLLDAAGRGVPVLSTKAGTVGQEWLPSFVKVSDSVAEWRRLCIDPIEPKPEWADEVDELDQIYGWKGVVKPLAARLHELMGQQG